MINKEIYDKLESSIIDCLDQLSEKERFSGAILVSYKNEIIINQGFGMANYELDVPNTSKTKFRIGSVTKQFTVAAIMQLCDRGMLSLEDTLNKYIPDYPRGEEVTIHHLLTHTAGIFNHTSIDGFVTNIMRNNHSVFKLIDEFKNLPFDFNPGSKFSYSNSGYILLGYIIEQVSKQSYKEYLKENFFNKLLMYSTGYDDNIEVIKNRASGYILSDDKKTLSNCDFIDMTVPYAAGALYSSVEDLYLWNRALFGGHVIGEKALAQMIKSHIDTDEKNFYGYGVFTSDVEAGGNTIKKVYHGGGIPGFFSANSIYPDKEIQIIMVTNIISEYFSEKVAKVESIVLEGLL